MRVLLANPRGFCAGVDRAIAIVEQALEAYGSPVYVRHELVHNNYVVDELRTKGAIFVEELSQIPDGSIVIFSAHGVSKSVRTEASRRRLRVFDATCPLVTKVHMEVERHCRDGREMILIGHRGHPEVEGTIGHYERLNGRDIYLIQTPQDVDSLQVKNPDFLAYVTQTTLSVDDTWDVVAALRRRFPTIVGPRKSDICFATQNRQDAVKRLAAQCDLILVVGSRTSSNSNRLREIAAKHRVETHLIDTPADIQDVWLAGKKVIGVTAGASAPEVLVQQVLAMLVEKGVSSCVEDKGVQERVAFMLPRDLRRDALRKRSTQSISTQLIGESS